jgi:putative membrane protein insertion efficiency factor
LNRTTTPPSNAGTVPNHHARRVPLAVAGILVAIRAYKVLISPLFTGCCRFHPSCADYMAEAVSTHGALTGVRLGLIRLAQCRPFGGHGVDPVPPPRHGHIGAEGP